MEKIIEQIIGLFVTYGLKIDFINFKNYEDKGVYLELSLKNKGE